MTNTVARMLRTTRKANGLSQRALAAQAGVGQNLVVRVEKGEDVRLSTLERVARAAGLEIRVVPRELTPAVDALVHAYRAGEDLEATMDKPMYELDEDI